MAALTEIYNTKTGLRNKSVQETLSILEANKSVFGVTRITNTTYLDRIGMPVFAAIRPDAGAGSITVTSGKSIDIESAKVGALAEAFELASARFLSGSSELHSLSFSNFRNACGYEPWSLPIRVDRLKGVRPISKSMMFSYVKCKTISDDRDCLIPASLIYFPYDVDLGLDLYGTSTNGLASGNTLEEAILHALLEVVERDVISFASLGRQPNRLTDIDDENILTLLSTVHQAGLELDILFNPNSFGIPVFSAFLRENAASDAPVFVGHGAHLSKSIALTRACTEAIQSRLTHIHGARDDVVAYHNRWASLSWEEKNRKIASTLARHLKSPSIRFGEIEDSAQIKSINEGLRAVVDKVKKTGLNTICYFQYPQLIENFFAVRVVVPGLEFYGPDRLCVGERILDYARSGR